MSQHLNGAHQTDETLVSRSAKLRVVLRGLLHVLAIGAVAILLLTLLLTVTGQRTGDALFALANGAAGTWYALTSATLVRAIPLALAGLAVSLAFRAGILNIGAEGQLLAGAAAATMASLAAPSAGVFTVPLVLLAGGVAGSLWAGIAAFLRQKFGVLEVISTIMLNYVALHTVGYLVRGPLQESTRVFPQSFNIDARAQLPIILPGTRLHLGFAIAVFIGAAMWWWLRDRAGGFRLRAVGTNARAAASAGRIDVARTTTVAFLVSGAIAGLAGASELSGVTYSLYETLSPGYGYTAVAVALLARLNPLGVLLAAVMFGALEAGANAMQRDADVPSVLISVVEAALILLVLAADRWRLGRVQVAEIAALIDAFLEATIRWSTPFALAAMGECVSERAGVINIGLEGSIIAGALGATVGAGLLGPTFGFAAGALSGVLIAVFFGVFTVVLRSDQIITGTAITMFSLGLTGTLYRLIYGAAGVSLSTPTTGPLAIPVLSAIPVIGPALFAQPPITYVLYATIAGIAWWMSRTQAGLALRAVGERPEAAAAAGVDVRRVQFGAVMFAGAMAGLAGATLVLAQAGTFVENMSAGRGFIAIAIVVLGRWRPLGVAAASLMFGAAYTLQNLFQSLGLQNVPYNLFLAIPYILTLIVLSLSRSGTSSPAALGQREIVSR